MLTLLAGQAESLWDEALPIEVRGLPADLAALDRLLGDSGLLAPIVAHWRREVIETRRAVLTDGRPTIAMETYIRLMVLKQRYRWGYRTLVSEVSDSIHLRRFCRIALSVRVPDESTVRKLTRRIGTETVNELTRVLIVKATRERRFRARAVRIDSTVIEADVKYPTDSGLAAQECGRSPGRARSSPALVGEQKRAGAGPLAGDGTHAARADAHDPSPQRRSEIRGSEADREDAASCCSGRSPRAGGWRHRRAGGRAAGARRRSSARRPSSSSSRTAARRSPNRSSSASPASRSTTGWSRSQTPTRGRSGRASSASRTSSAM